MKILPIDRIWKWAGQMFDRKRAGRLARQGLDAVKRRARRRDLLGKATYSTLSTVHDGLGTAAHGLQRLVKASEPPARARARRPAQARGAARGRAQARGGARRSAQAREGARPSTPQP